MIKKIIITTVDDIFDAILWVIRIATGLLLLVLCGGIIAAVAAQAYTNNFLATQDYKDITQRDSFAQTSFIQDRNGRNLYGFFEEDREYVSIDKISNSLIHAIISAEDKTFRTNQGYDGVAIMRAAKNNLNQWWTQGKIDQLQGGSTITQQLIKNINLTTQKTLQRKLNEVILAEEFTNILIKHIKTKDPTLTYSQQTYLAKKYILELYLNYIFLGNHSYGVQSAAKKYFGVPASDLSVAQSSIIASLPKAPSSYDPYTNRGDLMGYRVIKKNNNITQLPASMLAQVHDLLFSWHNNIKTKAETIEQLTLIKGGQGTINEFFQNLGSIQVTSGEQNIDILYVPGRKDYVLGQMYFNNHISAAETIDAFIEATNQEFLPVKFPIRAPHFVYRVKDMVLHDPEFSNLNITEQSLSRGGFSITTTLDYEVQSQVEQLIANNSFLLNYYEGNNRAVLITNPHDGSILTYIGSSDFWNDEIEGKNDLVRSQKQPGSTMKPFIYAYGMMKYALGPHNTILDDKMTIGQYEPQNADGKFRGLTTIAQALAGSRNIPALKIFQANGGESVMKPYLKELGFTTLDDEHSYGLSLAIGGGDSTMLELSQAYSHLATTGDTIPVINPILEIKNNKGQVVYSRAEQEKKVMKKIIPNAVSRLIRDILSKQKNAPSGWYNMLSVKGLQNYAIKTGTSDKKVFNNQGEKETRPKDGWLVMYSPNMIITLWAGNTDGSAMRDKAFGGTLNSPLLQDIIKMMSEQGYTNDQGLPRPDDQIYKGRYASPRNDWRPSSIAE